MRMALKLAIVASGRPQRGIARASRMAENRLSEIVQGWVTPTATERDALKRVLQIDDTAFEDGAAVEVRSFGRG